MEMLFHCKSHTLKNVIFLEQKGFKGWTSKMSRCDAEQNFFQETYQPHYFTLFKAELRVPNGNVFFHRKRHTFKNCNILGQEGFIGQTSNMSWCDTEPDFFNETYQLNCSTLIGGEQEFQRKTLFHCKSHTLQNCIILG